MRLYIYFPCTYNMCVCVVRKKKTMIMFGQRVSEKIGIKTSSLYSFYVWNIVGNGKKLYPIIFIESFYVINCCLSCYKSYSFKKHFVLILFAYSIICYDTKYLIKIIRNIMLKKLRRMSDSSFDTSDCETKIMIMALSIYFFSFINTFSNGVLRSYIFITYTL